MICNNCGGEINDNALFCKHCGASVNAPRSVPEGQRISDNITLGQDGKYRWRFEMSLFRNPTVFLLVWKIFFFIIIGIFGFITIIDLIENDDFFPDRFLGNLKVFGIVLLGMTVLTAVGFLIYALIMGGKYIVDFEMDEQGIKHSQLPAQAAKARKISEAAFLAGAAAKSPTTMGVGLTSTGNEMYSEFSMVKKVRAYPKRNLIKVNQTLQHNQVYAAPEDFEFVKDYIISRCGNLK